MFVTHAINRIRAEVFSQIVRAGIQDTAVVDDVAKAPQLLSVTVEPREPREGDQVTVTIDAAANPTTLSPVVKYYLLASIDGFIVYDSFTDSVTTFRAVRTGILTAEASAIDAEGRTSRVARAQATVGNVVVDCEVYPDLPSCGTQAGVSFLVAALLIFGVVIFAVLFSALAPGATKLLVFAATLGVGLVALWAFGFLAPIVGGPS